MPKPKYEDWIKLHRSLRLNIKVMGLDDFTFRAWIFCLIDAGETGDERGLIDVERVAFGMRAHMDRLLTAIETMVDRGLIDTSPGGKRGVTYSMHEWSEWQGGSKTEAERKKAQRAKERSGQRPDNVRTRGEESTSLRSVLEESVVPSSHNRGEETRVRANDEPQKSQIEKPTEAARAAVAAEFAAEVAPRFDRVWKFYLEFGDARSRRGRAETAFAAIDRETQGEVCEGLVMWRLSRYVRGDTVEPPKFLETWLDERGWRDYPLDWGDGRYAKQAETVGYKLFDGPPKSAED